MICQEVIDDLTKHKLPILIITEDTEINLIDKTLVTEDTNLAKNYTFPALVLIYFETCDDVTLFGFNHIKKEMQHIIIITDPNSNNCIDKLKEISHLISEYDATIILLDISNDKHRMYTFISKIDGETCKQIVKGPTHINTCINGTLENNVIFPPKYPSNLNKCPFRVGMATLFPFSQVEGKELLNKYDRLNKTNGSDMKLMNIATEYFNATLELYYIYRKEENPYLENDFIELMQNGSLDVCAGGLYRIYGDLVAYSGIYARQAVVWIYYVERVERSWKILVGKVNGLYIFVIFYFSYTVIWYVICMFDDDAVSLRNTILYGWGALIGAASLQDARSIKQKILNLGYLIMCIHLSAYISFQLYSFLTIRDPPKMFNTIEEIMTSGRVPYLKASTKYFISDEKYLKFANTSAECTSFMDCAEKTFENNGLTIVLQANFYDFQAATAVNGEARILRAAENLLTVYNEMLIRKDSPLVMKFQGLTQTLFEAGITERLYNEAIGIHAMAKANTANSNMIMNSYSCQAGCTITFMQFAGVFYVWLFGCALSCLVFILEICFKREKIQRIVT